MQNQQGIVQHPTSAVPDHGENPEGIKSCQGDKVTVKELDFSFEKPSLLLRINQPLQKPDLALV